MIMQMMKRFLLVIFACIALTAQAQDSVQVLRFGFLSYESALKSTPEYGEVQMKMDSLRSAFQAELQRVEEEFNRSEDDLPHNEGEMTTKEEVDPEVAE